MDHNPIISLPNSRARSRCRRVDSIFSLYDCCDVHVGQKLSIHLTYLSDDSYTPSALAIRAGTGLGDLQDVRVVTFDKPEGWITFDISSEPNEEGEGL